MVDEKIVDVKEEKNEFENLGVEEEAPTQEFSETPEASGSMLDDSDTGQVYDFTKAPDDTRAPPRVDMDGKEVVVIKAEIKLPGANRLWEVSKSGKAQYKYCTFKLYYDFERQQENVAGLRVFKRDDNKYSHPSIMRDRVNQSSRLLGLYADFKKKDINEVSLSEFMNYLNTKPKVRIKCEIVENPETKEKVKKNMIGEFLP